MPLPEGACVAARVARARTRAALDTGLHPVVTSLLSACWQHAPEARPTMAAVHAQLEELLDALVAPAPPRALAVPVRGSSETAGDDSAHYHTGPLPRVDTPRDGTGGF